MIYLFKYVKATARQYTDTVWPHIILTTSLGTLYFQQFIQIGISRWHASSACHLPLYSPVDAEGGRSGGTDRLRVHGSSLFFRTDGHPLAHRSASRGETTTGSRESLCKAPQRIAEVPWSCKDYADSISCSGGATTSAMPSTLPL